MITAAKGCKKIVTELLDRHFLRYCEVGFAYSAALFFF
jgi:hypothetical protein